MKKLVVFFVPVLGAIALTLLLWNWALAAASLTNTGLTVDEGSNNNQISSSELSVGDGITPANEFIYTVDAVPTNGTLANSGTPLANGGSFSQADIDAGNLTYSHDGSETSTDSFDFQVSHTITGTLFTNETFNLTITPVNDGPTAVADAIELDEGGTATTLVGGSSSVRANDTDPDNVTADLSVSVTTPPSHDAAFTLDSDGTFSYQHDDSENFSDSFTYEVCDPEPLCDTATVNITINGVIDVPPTISDDTFNVDENASSNTLVGTVTASDVEVPDYDALSFTITDGNIDTAFSINASGEIRVNNTAAIDYEIPRTSFTLEVEVADQGSNTATATITVNVNDVNESPIIDDQSLTIAENSSNGTDVGQVNASDPDAGDSLSYAITSSPCDNIFTINSVGRVFVNDGSALNHENTPSYGCTIEVEDSGDLTNSATVTINVTDVNEAPNISGATFSVDENKPNNGNVGTVSASDPDADDDGNLTYTIVSQTPSLNAFKIGSSSGQITVNDSTQLDFEDTPSFTVRVRVTDSGGPGGSTLSDAANFTINLNDVNETPSIPSGQSFSVPENSGNGTAVGTVNASDPDTDDDGALTFAITAGDPTNAFAITPSTGAITVNNGGQLNFETKTTYNLTVQVTDSGGPEGSGNELNTAQTVTVNVTNVNETPSLTAGQTFSIVGFANEGRVVGTVTATDPDAGDTLTYAITGGNPLNAFRINAVNGRLIVNNSDALDFDVRPTFNLQVKVTDAGGLSNTKTVVVNLTEPPTFFVMLPMIVRNYRADEPNNNCSQSHRIATNATHTYLPEDTNDWYAFTLNSTSNVTISVTDFSPVQGQVLLYSGTCGNLTFIKNNGNFEPTKILTVNNLPAGNYHVWVITDGPKSNTNLYNLRISTQ